MNKFDIAYMKMAIVFSELSHCVRSKVGAVIVKDGNVIACGYNGMPSGFDNCCEEKNDSDELVTKKESLHAESNCIAKIAKSNNSSQDATMYVTLSPCVECSKLLIQSGIKKLFYLEDYRDSSGLNLLQKAGVEILKINL